MAYARRRNVGCPDAPTGWPRRRATTPFGLPPDGLDSALLVLHCDDPAGAGGQVGRVVDLDREGPAVVRRRVGRLAEEHVDVRAIVRRGPEVRCVAAIAEVAALAEDDPGVTLLGDPAHALAADRTVLIVVGDGPQVDRRLTVRTDVEGRVDVGGEDVDVGQR